MTIAAKDAVNINKSNLSKYILALFGRTNSSINTTVPVALVSALL